MLIGTHALLPVAGCLVVDQVRLRSGSERWFESSSLIVVAVFGVLTDLCSPHLSLEDRYGSWTHNLGFLVGAMLASAAAGSFFATGRRTIMALACWLAIVWHLAADAVSGGIVWLSPWRDEVLGGPYIPYRWWWWSDLGFVVLTLVLLRLTRWLESRGEGT
ncbi:MAG: metal-dependent hydrolase [Akkermansiaceae bacterium]|nr:metal-dependent hydrolase [Akkermansiaceae bacterium]MCF7732574.1 metal-dependent hydrolase [Akkermansiaceae bacterium]